MSYGETEPISKARFRPLLDYGIAVLTVGLALLLQLTLVPLFGGDPHMSPFMAFFAAVMVAAWFGGLWPGLSATALSALLSSYFFLFPQYSLQTASPAQGLHLAVFVLEGALISALVGIMHSARRRAEANAEALQRSEQQYRTLVEQIPAATYTQQIAEPDSSKANPTLYASPQIEAQSGYPPQAFVENPELWIELLHPEDRDRVLAEDRRTDETGEPYSVEYRQIARDGRVAWIRDEAVLIRDEEGRPRFWQGVMHDITESKRVEEALKESEGRFRTIFEQAAVGMVQVKLGGEWVRFNDRFCEILGYTRDELPTIDFRDILLPGDLEWDLERGKQMISGGFQDYWEEKRIRRKDGSLAWINLTVSLVYSSGEPEHFVAVLEDITERKKAEEALSRNEILYRTVVEQAAENIFFVDIETKRILDANAALSRSLGYSPEELREMSLYDIVAHDRESIDTNVKHIVERERQFLGERQYLRKDGSLVDVEASVSVVPYGDSKAMCIVAHDTTERKRAEENLRRSLSVLLALREAGRVLGSTLSSEEIVSRLLEIMRGVSHLTAAVISVPDGDGELRIWRSAGLEGLQHRARFEREAEAARRSTLEVEEQRLFRVPGSESGDNQMVGLCLPLRIKDRVVGVLEAYGEESLLADRDTVEILNSLTSQAASALENARLYEELEERERELQDLIGKLLRAQEEEQRRVAYEVHDGLAQIAVAAHQRLQAFARRHTPDTERGQRDLDRILNLVRATVSDARRIIANLRPTTLDDLGLAATLALEVERLREDGYQVDYEDQLGDERLPDAVEITLFRVAQEALNNTRKHALTRRISIRLGRSGNLAHLEVRDYGLGFDPSGVSAGSGPGERVGLAGMRERVGMVGGELKIFSRPDVGTSIAATVPLTRSL